MPRSESIHPTVPPSLAALTAVMGEIASVTNDERIDVATAYRQIAALIPRVTIAPAEAVGAVVVADALFGDTRARDAAVSISATVAVDAARAVTAFVGYPAIPIEHADAAFSDTERMILNAVARHVATFASRRELVRRSREYETTLLTILSQVGEAVALVDPNGIVVEANDAAANLSGVTREAMIGSPIYAADAIDPGADLAATRIARVFAGEDLRFETQRIRADGEVRDVIVRLKAVTLNGRRLVSVVLSDVTDLRRAERHQRALVGRVHRFNSALVRLGTHMSLVDGDVAAFGREVAAALRTSLEATFAAIWILSDDEATLECVACSTQGDTAPMEPHARVPVPPGLLDALVQSRTLLIDELDPAILLRGTRTAFGSTVVAGGQLTGLLVAGSTDDGRTWDNDDLTFGSEIADQLGMAIVNRARVSAERESNRNTALLARAQQIAAIGFWHVDLGTGESHLSPGAYRVFGLPPGSSPTQEQMTALIHPDDREHVAAVRRAMHPGEQDEQRYRIVAGGEERWVVDRIELTATNGEGSSEILGVIRDVTGEVETEREIERYQEQLEDLVRIRTGQLERARDRAEAASSAKSAFLANVSHEIRTPMNAIVGYAHLLAGGDLDDAQRRRVARLNESARHLLSLINNILDLSRLESGRAQLDEEIFSPTDVLQSAAELVASDAEAKGIGLERDFEGLPEQLSGDRVRLSQAAINLVANAVKFTDRGAVRLSARWEWIGTDRGTLQFEVRDTGPGIAESEIARLFRPFEQADSSTTRRYGGSGLGLAITQSIVDLMQGRIDVSSVVDEGTTFTVTLPFVAVKHIPIRSPAPRSDARHDLSGARLLVVDDDETTRDLIGHILRRAGAEVTTAENGRAAVELIATETVHLILMDVEMHHTDGLAATREIRSRYDATVPVIAITARSTSIEPEQCGAAGMNDHLTKPVEPERLLAVVARWLGRTAAPSPPGPNAPSEVDAGPTVDSSAARSALRRVRELLAEADTAVNDEFAAAAQSLQSILGDDYARVASLVGRYRYDEALHAIAQATEGMEEDR